MSTPTSTVEDIDIPSKGFVDEYSVERIDRPSVTLVLKRNVVGPLLVQEDGNGNPHTKTINGVHRARINTEKFISKERLMGIDLLRTLDDDGDLIHPDYRYNRPDTWNEALNLDPLTYGAAGTEAYGESFMLKSHLEAGYTYTNREFDPLDTESRNMVEESGTMQRYNPDNTDDEQADTFEQNSALYEKSPISAGNSFVQFVTIEAGLPGMLLYALHNILNTTSYGGSETRHGGNIRNEVLGLIKADHPVSLGAGELLMMHRDEDNSLQDDIVGFIESRERDHWDVYFRDGEGGYPAFPDWFDTCIEIAGRKSPHAREQLNRILTHTTHRIRQDLQCVDEDDDATDEQTANLTDTDW